MQSLQPFLELSLMQCTFIIKKLLSIMALQSKTAVVRTGWCSTKRVVLSRFHNNVCLELIVWCTNMPAMLFLTHNIEKDCVNYIPFLLKRFANNIKTWQWSNTQLSFYNTLPWSLRSNCYRENRSFDRWQDIKEPLNIAVTWQPKRSNAKINSTVCI